MSLRDRVRKLEARIPPRGRADIPTDEEGFYRGLLGGRFTPDDTDPRNPDHTTWLATLAAHLTMNQPERPPAD